MQITRRARTLPGFIASLSADYSAGIIAEIRHKINMPFAPRTLFSLPLIIAHGAALSEGGAANGGGVSIPPGEQQHISPATFIGSHGAALSGGAQTAEVFACPAQCDKQRPSPRTPMTGCLFGMHGGMKGRQCLPVTHGAVNRCIFLILLRSGHISFLKISKPASGRSSKVF